MAAEPAAQALSTQRQEEHPEDEEEAREVQELAIHRGGAPEEPEIDEEEAEMP